jgi:signal transduction histidine kinase
VRPISRVIPRDEALYRLSVFATAGCIAVMLAALFTAPASPLDQSVFAVILLAAIGACVLTLATVERLLRTLRLQRAEMAERGRAHAEDLQTVVELARRLPGSADAHTAREGMCRGVLEVCGGMMAILMEPDGAGSLVASAVAGADAAPMRVSLDDEASVTVEAYRSGEPYFVAELDGHPAVSARLAASLNAVSALWQPVIRGDEPIGVLVVVWDRPLERLSERAAAVVGLFAAEAAIAIERADLLARMEGLNRTLRMQVEALRVSDQLKTDFVSSVSHELRTPLASIIGYVDVMLDGDVGSFTGEQREFMGIVQENARRLLALINDLLTLSGVESGKMVLRRELTDLRGVVERCVRDQVQVAEASELHLSLVLPADPVEAHVDADRFGQVVNNLLANAIKFTGAGGRVGVALGRTRNGVALSVSDTGIGIADDDQARLFERFFRARNAADNSIPGTGLGLAISKGIVDAHGGTLTVESVLDEGTAITVLLPTEPLPRTPSNPPKETHHVRV